MVECFKDNLLWNVGNGNSTLFWHDNWIPNGEKLISYVSTEVPENLVLLTVDNFTLPNGDWNLNLLSQFLPPHIIQLVNNMPTLTMADSVNTFTWGSSPDGSFTTKSAYATLMGSSNSIPKPIFKHIWKWKGMERIRTFLWKLGHEAILTNSERCRRNIATSNMCPLCNDAAETLFHLFRDCSTSLRLWNNLSDRYPAMFFTEHNWNNWLIMNLKQSGSRNEDQYWNITFGVTLDWIWRNRNEKVFSNSFSNTKASVMKIRIGVECIMANLERRSFIQPLVSSTMERETNLWIPPPIGSWKLSCDGSVTDGGRSASCGGVLRDHQGNFIFGYSCRLQPCSTLDAELFGIFHGMQIARNRNLNSLVIESDSLQAIELLTGVFDNHHPSFDLLQKILLMKSDEALTRWVKIGRDCNSIADILAKQEHVITDLNSIVIYESIPTCIDWAFNSHTIGPMF